MAGIEIKLPNDVTAADNGQVRDELLVGCGVFSSFFPHRELEMHHLFAARAMRAMSAEASKTLNLEQVRATGAYRDLQRQIDGFDGTIPGERSGVNGRYIPEELWGTFGPGQLLPKVKTWRNKKWRRRKDTEETATPGTSNHGWGLAIDFDRDQLPLWLDWLRKNAHRFGFVDEVDSEDWHWSYRLGNAPPPELPGRDSERDGRDGVRRGRDTKPDTDRALIEEDDMRIIDLAPNTPSFTRLVIAGRIKWVRGLAAPALDNLKVAKSEVRREELVDLLRTFGSEGLSPFNAASRSAAPDPELDAAWEAARV